MSDSSNKWWNDKPSYNTQNMPQSQKTHRRRRTYAPREDLDQPAHWRRQVRIITGRIMDSRRCIVSSYRQRRLWSDCADALTGLSRRRAHMSDDTFYTNVKFADASVQYWVHILYGLGQCAYYLIKTSFLTSSKGKALNVWSSETYGFAHFASLPLKSTVFRFSFALSSMSFKPIVSRAWLFKASLA